MDLSELMEILPLLPRVIPAYPLLTLNYYYAKFFLKHKHKKIREVICWLGVSCSFLLTLIGPISLLDNTNEYLIYGVIILGVVSAISVISCFYFHFVDRPTIRDIERSVAYEPLLKEK